MCEFVSWVEGPGKAQGQKQVWFLTDHEVYETSRGQELCEWSASKGDEDCLGHGAIRFYYELPPEKGKDKECVDFSTPANFPPQIALAIVAGAFARLAGEVPKGLLSESLADDYDAKVKLLADDYWAKVKLLADDYDAKVKLLVDDYWAKRSPLDADRWAKVKLLAADRWAKVKPLAADYWAKRKLLDNDYWALLADPDNRAEAWRAV